MSDVLDPPVTAHGAIPSELDGLAALYALGDTTDEIANSLREKGITGVPQSRGNCPLARYLKLVFPSLEWIVGFRARGFCIGSSQVAVWAELPRSLLHFVRRFDDKRYLDLIDTGLIDTDLFWVS